MSDGGNEINEGKVVVERSKSSKQTLADPKNDPTGRPTKQQLNWLVRGLDQPGGKLPLFDDLGKKISSRTVESCLKNGWAEPWFNNPLKPDWQVCKLTETGHAIAKSLKK